MRGGRKRKEVFGKEAMLGLLACRHFDLWSSNGHSRQVKKGGLVRAPRAGRTIAVTSVSIFRKPKERRVVGVGGKRAIRARQLEKTERAGNKKCHVAIKNANGQESQPITRCLILIGGSLTWKSPV